MQQEESQFTSYVHADGEFSIPNGISTFAASGGHERWTTIQIPEYILELPQPEQVLRMQEMTAAYRREHKRQVPFFGALKGFKLVLLNDYYQFDAVGSLTGHVDQPFCRGVASISFT